jgi:hypothetical protein
MRDKDWEPIMAAISPSSDELMDKGPSYLAYNRDLAFVPSSPEKVDNYHNTGSTHLNEIAVEDEFEYDDAQGNSESEEEGFESD